MLRFPARYYDGVSPKPHDVEAVLGGAVLSILEDGVEIARWAAFDLFLPAQDKSLPEAYLASKAAPDARLVVKDRAAQLALADAMPGLARLAKRSSHGGRRALVILAGGVAAVLVGLGVALWRGPEMLAPFVPQSWQEELGDTIVAFMTSDSPRCTTPAGSAALDAMVAKLKAATDYKGRLQVEVVDNKVVNAFAVPGGRIVIFRGLIDQAESPDQVAAVVAHEIGHVVKNHPMRGLLRQLGLSLLQHLALGDYGDAVGSATSLGQTMLAFRNGRDAEREADDTALALLDGAGLKANGLSSFFAAMRKKSGDVSRDLGWLSTHPGLDEREQTTKRDDSGAPALTAAQWKDLQAICGTSVRGDKPSRNDGNYRSNPAPAPAPTPKGRGNGKDRL